MALPDSDADSDNEQLQRYVSSPEHKSRSSSHEAAHAVLAYHFGHEVIDVTTDGEIIPQGSPDSMLVSGGELAATGGGTRIDWVKMDLNHPDFDDYLQNIATVLMAGRAAEELTHPEKVVPAHWKADLVYFQDVARQARRTESQIRDFLEEGFRRAQELLQRADVSRQHQRVRDYLIAGRSTHPNGKFITRRVMKGFST